MYIDRIDTHGLILWLPAMPDATRAEIARQIVAEIVATAASADDVIELLDMRGFDLRLKVEHHGPQTYRIWSLSARRESWASARLAEAVG